MLLSSLAGTDSGTAGACVCVCAWACRNSWGFMTAGRICADMAQACLIAAGRGCGATLGAVAARKLEDAEAFAADLGCAKAYGGDSVRNHNNKTAAGSSGCPSVFVRVFVRSLSWQSQRLSE